MSGEDHAAWSPDGKRLATIRGNYVSIWDAADGKELTTLRGHESTLPDSSFSPDGKLVLTTSWDRTARVWNAETGEQAAVLRGHQTRVNTASPQPGRPACGRPRRQTGPSGSGGWIRRAEPGPAARRVDRQFPRDGTQSGRQVSRHGAGRLFQAPAPGSGMPATGKVLHRLQGPAGGIARQAPDRDGFAECPPAWSSAPTAGGC